MEMRVVFATLLGRMSDLAYAESGRGALIVPSALVRNCTEMQITFTPR
jgi:cytochrome P450